MPGEVDEVMCFAGSFTGECEYDATVVLLLHFADGNPARWPASWRGTSRTASWCVCTGEGTLVQNRLYADLLDR